WQLANVHWQHCKPFCVQQQLQQPSASMRQRVCNVAHDSSSSHLQWILNPPVHFSNSILHRGTTHQLPAAGAAAGKPLGCHVWGAADELGDPSEKRSITTAFDMKNSFLHGPALGDRFLGLRQSSPVESPRELGHQRWRAFWLVQLGTPKITNSSRTKRVSELVVNLK